MSNILKTSKKSENRKNMHIKGNIFETLSKRLSNKNYEDREKEVEKDIEEDVITKNIVKITGDIDDEVFDTILELVIEITLTDNKEDIILIIDSPGGYVPAMFSIIDLLNSIPNKIITINMGMAGSCASNLFVLGDKRYMAKHAMFLFHSPALLAEKAQLNLKHLKNEIKSLDDICAHFENSLSTRTKIPKELIKEGISTSDGVILNSDECLKYGVTDEILTDFQKIII